jgi:Fe-S-cluster-containing dehydrogenase component
VNCRVLIVDDEKCTGCQLCLVACAARHEAGLNADRARIDVCRTADDSHAPLICNHCEAPSCARACPTGACRVDPAGGRVIIDDRVCIGCRTCVVACPFQHARFDKVLGVTVKCDFCDGAPVCVEACEAQAIHYVYAEEAGAGRRREVGLRRLRPSLKTIDSREP